MLIEALAARPPLIVDGAMATELEKRGVDTANALWSAMALLDRPEAIRDVHRSYFEAGANIAVTDTYQANIPAFERLGLRHADAERLIALAVSEALAAREDYRLAHVDAAQEGRPLLVAGSVGPYGAFLADGSEYTGAYELPESEYRDFHRPRMRVLADAGVDLFAFETMPNLGEVRALANLLADEFPEAQAWMSFSLRDAGHLCDGTCLEAAAAAIDDIPQIGMLGVNCVPPSMVEEAVGRLRSATGKAIVVYPNNGDVYHPDTKTWTPAPGDEDFVRLAPRWLEAGASLIGGCCRTTPDDIRRLARRLGDDDGSRGRQG